MRDFTLEKYHHLLSAIIDNKYSINTVGYASEHLDKMNLIVMKHDIDKRPLKALEIAQIEQHLGVRSTYFFRTTPGVFDKEIIWNIHEMGHEIGYHYEVLARSKGDHDVAIEQFKKELGELKELVPISSISMHGSPLSPWNELDLWETFDYEEFGISTEAFLSFDFTEVPYFTDAGRTWNGERFVIRDKVKSQNDWKVRSTDDLIGIFANKSLPNAVINVHPQRWNSKLIPWTMELVGQNVKNVGKLMLRKWRSTS